MTIFTLTITEDEAQAVGYALTKAREHVASLRPCAWTDGLDDRLERAYTALDNAEVEER